MISWQAQIQRLSQPLQTWLMPSYLTSSNDSIVVLFVDPSSLDLVNIPSSIALIYPLIKDIHPEIRSLHLLSSSLIFFMKNNILEFHSIEVL